MNAIDLCERGLVPDVLTRVGMRRLIGGRLREERRAARPRFADELRESPIAIATADANRQHYEVPAEFFRLHLGPRRKYSCCLYEPGAETLAQAEEAMLALYAQRAELADGMRILDLGCGWGSLSLWLAEKYPRARIVGLSNSASQRESILARAAECGLANLEVITGNVVDFDFDEKAARFDRVLSIEMFEHMRNYRLLLAKLARWLAPDGKLFVHIFAHRTVAYPFEDQGASDWMSRWFFTGGIMPSADLLLQFQDHLEVVERWWLDGTHYRRTAEDWLARLDRARDDALAVLRCTYGAASAEVWLQRWRMFYMAVAELFGFEGGRQWGVGHYLFTPPRR